MQSLFEERQQRLQKKLRLLYEQYDLESRVEEKMRLESVVKATQAELQAGRQDYLPSSLLACAALYRHISDFTHARETLQELFALATSSGMRLYLTDYHLEMARLLVAEQDATAQAGKHITIATQLINDTGYHRRDIELAALQQLVNN